MSSGTQIELDWTGVDAGRGGTATPPAIIPSSPGAGAGAYLTDEEILGIDTPSPNGGFGGSDRRDVIPSPDKAGINSTRNHSSIENKGNEIPHRDSSGNSSPRLTENAHREQNDNEKISAAVQGIAAQMPAWLHALAGDPKHGAEAQQLWQEHQAFRASFSSPEEARAIKELFPGGAQEAAGLRQASQSVDRIDAAIFSGDVRAQSEVVAELAQANPAAFRSLFAEAAKVLAGMGQTPSSAAADYGGRGTQQTALTNHAPATDTSNGRQDAGATSQVATPVANHPSQELKTSPSQELRAGQSPTFDPAAYASFERSTNDAVARDVRSTIGDTLSRVLPEGLAEGAARRIGEDIFNEVHRALAADRTLSEQVGAALRAPVASGQGWQFGSAEQQRVASLLTGRAKQLVPSVARRVIGEWTSSVLGTARTKAARQATAASRVDIAAAGGSLDSMPLRAMSPREVNYASMSDDDILGM